jgi:hypothetical protein
MGFTRAEIERQADESERRHRRSGRVCIVSSIVAWVLGAYLVYGDNSYLGLLAGLVSAISGIVAIVTYRRYFRDGFSGHPKKRRIHQLVNALPEGARLMLHCAKWNPNGRIALMDGLAGLDLLVEFEMLEPLASGRGATLYRINETVLDAILLPDLIKGRGNETNLEILRLDRMHDEALNLIQAPY